MSMYELFTPGTLANVEFKIGRGKYVPLNELESAVRGVPDDQIPESVKTHRTAMLAGKIHKPRGKSQDPIMKELVLSIEAARYARLARQLRKRRYSKVGLEGWSPVKNADWWQGPPNERAARMVAERLNKGYGDIYGNISWRHARNEINRLIPKD